MGGVWKQRRLFSINRSEKAMSTITYIRPSGNPLTVSDNAANRAYAAANGWVEQGKEAKEPKAPKEQKAPK